MSIYKFANFSCLHQNCSAGQCHSKGPVRAELTYPGVLGDFSSPVPSTRSPHRRPAVSCADVQVLKRIKTYENFYGKRCFV